MSPAQVYAVARHANAGRPLLARIVAALPPEWFRVRDEAMRAAFDLGAEARD